MGWLFGGQRVESRSWSPVAADGREPIDSGVAPVPSLRLVPLFAATRLIADQVASAPLRAYRPDADGARRVLPTQPQLLRAPDMSTPFAWKHRAISSLLLWGNAYGLITARDSSGSPTALVWLPPSKVQCVGDGISRSTFTMNGRPLPTENVVHIPAYAVPGQAAGVSPISAFRLTIDTGRAAQEYARQWYDGGGIPAAVVRNATQTLTPEQAQSVKDRLRATLRNGEPFVTGSDWSYELVGAPSADARFIETMRLTATQIAAVYGVPPEEVGGETGSSLTYSTLEQNAQKLAVQTVRPWAVRIEEALSGLFAGKTYIRFNLDTGVRADLRTRYEAHEIALRNGLETLSEARALEERPPLTDAEVSQWQSLFRPSSEQRGETDASH